MFICKILNVLERQNCNISHCVRPKDKIIVLLFLWANCNLLVILIFFLGLRNSTLVCRFMMFLYVVLDFSATYQVTIHNKHVGEVLCEQSRGTLHAYHYLGFFWVWWDIGILTWRREHYRSPLGILLTIYGIAILVISTEIGSTRVHISDLDANFNKTTAIYATRSSPSSRPSDVFVRL